jgi:hypothetical protein
MRRTHAGLLVQKDVYPSLEYFVHKNSNTLTLPCPKDYLARYADEPVGVGALYDGTK